MIPATDAIRLMTQEINIQVQAHLRPFQIPYASTKENALDMINAIDNSRSMIQPSGGRETRTPRTWNETVERTRNKTTIHMSMIPPIITKVVSTLTAAGLADRIIESFGNPRASEVGIRGEGCGSVKIGSTCGSSGTFTVWRDRPHLIQKFWSAEIDSPHPSQYGAVIISKTS